MLGESFCDVVFTLSIEDPSDAAVPVSNGLLTAGGRTLTAS